MTSELILIPEDEIDVRERVEPFVVSNIDFQEKWDEFVGMILRDFPLNV